MVVRMRKVLTKTRSWYVCFSAEIDILYTGTVLIWERGKMAYLESRTLPMIVVILRTRTFTLMPGITCGSGDKETGLTN